MHKLLETTKGKYLTIFFILVITFVLFARVGSFGFISVWDDNLNVLNNNYIKDFSFNGLHTLFSRDTQIGEPRLTLFSYAIDYKLWKLDPTMYHIENLLFHLINIVLVFVLCLKLIPKKIGIAAIVTILFAIHPFRIESIAWVSGRKDLLYSMFFLLSLITYTRYIKKAHLLLFLLVMMLSYLSILSKIQAVTLPFILLLFDYYFKRVFDVKLILEKVIIVLTIMPYSFSFLVLLIAFFVLLFFKYYDQIKGFIIALKININHRYPIFVNNKHLTVFNICLAGILSLSSYILLNFIIRFSDRRLVILFVVLFVVWFFFEKWINKNKERRNYFIFKHHIWFVPLLSVLIGVVGFKIFFPDSYNLYFWNPKFTEQFTFIDQIFMAGYSFVCYLFYSIFPLSLSSLRPYPDFSLAHLPVSYYLLSVLAFAIIVFIVWIIVRIKNVRRELIFGFSFFFLNIFLVLHIIPIEGRVIITERYTYLAYFGLFFIIGVFFNKLYTEKNMKKVFLISPFLLFVILFFSISYMRLPVWKDESTLVNEQIEKNPEYHMVYLNRANLFINRQKYIEAIEDLDKSIKLKPDYYQAYYNRALAFSALNLFDKAVEDCTQAIYIEPGFAGAYYIRAYSFNKIRKYHQAIFDYGRALKIDSTMYLAYYNRGNSKKNIFDFIGAADDYNKALKINPDFSEAYNGRGVVKFFMNDFTGSINDYSKAIQLSPQNASNYYNRALSYKRLNEKEKACLDISLAVEKGYGPAADSIYDSYCK